MEKTGREMKKRLLLLGAILGLMLVLTACGGEKEPVTLESLAEDQGVGVGEFQKSYALQPSGGFSIPDQASISKQAEMTVHENNLKNVVAIKTVSGFEVMNDFMNDYASFTFYDAYGNADSGISTYIWDDGEFIEILLEGANPIDNVRYVEIRGLSDHNANTSVLYEIK